MSFTSDLSTGYANFFFGAGKFAFSPYIYAFNAFGNGGHHGFDPLTAFVGSALLTFVVPVLPIAFSVTASLAWVAVGLGLASMFVMYPCAFIGDLVAGHSIVDHKLETFGLCR